MKNRRSSAILNKGLPELDAQSKAVSFFEFWPAWFFYTPVVIYWVFLALKYRNLGLPMAVNPNLELGGMIGESKVEILELGGELAQQYILPFITGEHPESDTLQNCDESLQNFAKNEIKRAAAHGILLPFVIKPEYGCRGAGVHLVESVEQLSSYLQDFPEDRRYMIQKLAPFAAEAGVFYERPPWKEKGSVTSITLKYRPYVTGDGVSTLRSLICRNPRASILRSLYFAKNREQLYDVPPAGKRVPLGFAGSHCRGSIFKDGSHLITEKLSEKIDQILQDFPEFHYGRLDIKFQDVDALQRGESFCLIEVNGVSSEKTHIWDSETPLWRVFVTLFEQYNTLFKMGHYLVKRGARAPSARKLVVSWFAELRRGHHYPDMK